MSPFLMAWTTTAKLRRAAIPRAAACMTVAAANRTTWRSRRVDRRSRYGANIVMVFLLVSRGQRAFSERGLSPPRSLHHTHEPQAARCPHTPPSPKHGFYTPSPSTMRLLLPLLRLNVYGSCICMTNACALSLGFECPTPAAWRMVQRLRGASIQSVPTATRDMMTTSP